MNFNLNQLGFSVGMKEKKYVLKRHHRYAAPIGALFLILALIGAVTVIVGSINLTGKILDSRREYEKFEEIITPVIIFDPIAFDDISQADPVFLLESSMWSVLLQKDASKFSYDENGLLVVPASDIDVAAKKLYGDSVTLEHHSFGDYEVTYVYDEELKVYKVPVMGQTGLFTPRVDKVVKNGDIYQLRVGYIPPTNLWTMNLEGEKSEPAPVKYMMYEMKKSGDSYILTAIKDLSDELKDVPYPTSSSMPEAPSSSQSSSSSSSSSSSQDTTSSEQSSSSQTEQISSAVQS